MPHTGRTLALFCTLTLAMLACSGSVDLGAPKPPIQGPLSTMVAETLQAWTQQALLGAASSTATATVTSSPTNTPDPPRLSVSAATDCHAGPGRTYGFVITLHPGITAQVVGRDAAGSYWIIEAPGYPGTVCWLSAQFATVSGDTSNVPSPATPPASIYTLSEPRNLRVSCSSEPYSDTENDAWGHDTSAWTVVFRWTNTETTQSGVRIFRNGRQLATLGAHAGSYTDWFVHHGHRDAVTYGVQAFNSTAVSSIVTIDLRHCD